MSADTIPPLLAKRSSYHGRILRTKLTDRGWQVLAEAHGIVAVIEASMMASLGEPNWARMTTALTRCAEDLQAGKTPAAMRAAE